MSQINNERRSFKHENRFFRAIINKLQAHDTTKEYYSVEKEEICEKYDNRNSRCSYGSSSLDDLYGNEKQHQCRQHHRRRHHQLTTTTMMTAAVADDYGKGEAHATTKSPVASSSSHEFKFKRKFSLNISNTILPRQNHNDLQSQHQQQQHHHNHQRRRHRQQHRLMSAETAASATVLSSNNSSLNGSGDKIMVTPTASLSNVLIDDEDYCDFRKNLDYHCCPTVGTARSLLSLFRDEEEIIGRQDIGAAASGGIEESEHSSDLHPRASLFYRRLFARSHGEDFMSMKSPKPISLSPTLTEKTITNPDSDDKGSDNFLENRSVFSATTTASIQLSTYPQKQQQIYSNKAAEIIGDYMHNVNYQKPGGNPVVEKDIYKNSSAFIKDNKCTREIVVKDGTEKVMEKKDNNFIAGRTDNKVNIDLQKKLAGSERSTDAINRKQLQINTTKVRSNLVLTHKMAWCPHY